MGVNEGGSDNAVVCVMCQQEGDAQTRRECSICESQLCAIRPRETPYYTECERNHLEAEFLEFVGQDMHIAIICEVGKAEPLRRIMVVKEPHYEGGGGDDGNGRIRCDEGWFWLEDGKPLLKEENIDVSDWVSDLIDDALNK
jgi:hypothetical protein